MLFKVIEYRTIEHYVAADSAEDAEDKVVSGQSPARYVTETKVGLVKPLPQLGDTNEADEGLQGDTRSAYTNGGL